MIAILFMHSGERWTDMSFSSPQHSIGSQVSDYLRSARTASALLALSDHALEGLGITRAHVRALARRLTD